MALRKIKIGDLIKIVDERNNYQIDAFYGININKEFMPTAASTEGLNPAKYKVVRKNRFVFSGMQTGRDECIRISLYLEESPIIVSPAYTTFEICDQQKILPEYLYMLFLSKEKDRLGWFYSDSSIRSNLDWNRFCEIVLNLPDLPTQEKFVNIYKAMVENQKAYERGLDDLKLVCDGYIEDLRKHMPCKEIGKYIFEHTEKVKNSNQNFSQDQIRGISSIEKKFMPTKADTNEVSIDSYKIVRPRYFSFNPNTARMGDKIPIALNTEDEDFLVSAIYPVFEVDESIILADYLSIWFKRSEFDRFARFNSWGSAREIFTLTDLQQVEIPVPDMEIQKSIANIYECYLKRKEINEKLKQQIKNLCPILIKGSIEEAR